MSEIGIFRQLSARKPKPVGFQAQMTYDYGNHGHRITTAEHEQATIRAFVVPDKQERFLGFLAKPKTRNKFIEELNYFRYFDRRFAAPLAWTGDPQGIAIFIGYCNRRAQEEPARSCLK